MYHNCPTITLLLAALVALLLAGCGNGGGIAGVAPPPQPAKSPVPVNPHPTPPTDQELQRGLAAVSWDFTPDDPTRFAGTIVTRDQALAAVQKQVAQEASSITTHFGLLRNQGLSQSLQAGQAVGSPFAQPHLVWIVTLSGVQGISSGPPGHQRKLSNELNVVIDAQTGAYLMDFVWTR